MQSAADVAKKNHPYMSASLQELLSLNMDIYAGNMATLMLGMSTVGQVKQMLLHLQKMGEKSQVTLDKQSWALHTPIDKAVAETQSKTRKKGRK